MFVNPIRVIKTVFIIIVLVFAPIFLSSVSAAEEAKVKAVVFVRVGCIHCQAEEKYLNTIAGPQNLDIVYYRIERASDSSVFEKFTAGNNLSRVTPITIIGNKYLIGFDQPQTSGKYLTDMVNLARKNNISTNLDQKVENFLLASDQTAACPENSVVPCKTHPAGNLTVQLPLVGELNSSQLPLIAMSAALGFFDGFNPCAMWVLVTFLIILIQIGSRRKMLVFAGTFILAEALMYSLILTVWYKAWNFVKLDNIVTPIIGAVAIVGGLIFIREWRKKEIACHVTDFKSRQNTRQKLQKLASDKFTVFTLAGILALAFSVNIIEFACSIGIPQAFTKILELNRLPLYQFIFYVAVYIVFYMIDDLLVFGLALYGADKLHISQKYAKISNLLGGIAMIVIGLLMIFKPSLLAL